MTRFHRLTTLVFILLALALSGCVALPSEEMPSADADQVAQATEAPAAEPTPTAIEEPTPAPVVEPTPTEEPEPTEVALGPPPAFSEEIIATDPQTVALGAGRPQVLEFFAFW